MAHSWTGETAWQIKELATKPDNLSWITETHMVGGGDRFLQTIVSAAQFRGLSP